MNLAERAEHLGANPGHSLRADGTCRCGLKTVPMDFPLRTVRTAPHRRLYHYWATTQQKALCRRNMGLRILSDYDEGQTICADCTRVAEEVRSTGHKFRPAADGPYSILDSVSGPTKPPVRVLPPHMRSQNTHLIRSRYRSRRVRIS